MGFLEAGTPLSWAQSLEFMRYGACGLVPPQQDRQTRRPAHPCAVDAIACNHAVREHGVKQFLRIFDRVKHRTNDQLLWGDEVCVTDQGQAEADFGAVAPSAACERVACALLVRVIFHFHGYSCHGVARLSSTWFASWDLETIAKAGFGCRRQRSSMH